MRVNFLSSRGIHLAKRFTPTEKTPYPLASHFTSHSYDVNTLEHFHDLIHTHANQGHCLLKGVLQRPLVDESRALSTSPDTPTAYILIDVDRCDLTITTHEQFVQQCLPPYFHNVDYIFQWSNSAGICKPGLTGHFWFLLAQDTNVKILKKALTYFNYLTPHLENQIQLAHNGQTLTYGLDPTCAQNDKLIFIAPPILDGLEDPHPTRIELVKHANRRVLFDLTQFNIAEIDNRGKNKLHALREAMGLPRKHAKFSNEGGLEVLKNPEPAIFRGPYIEARGFRYGNLNNGDSYAYFHPLENPKYIYNFKGEPALRIQDIDPDYWRQLQNEHHPVDPKKLYLAYRDRRTDYYYTTIYDTINDTHETYSVGNEKKALDFLKIYQQPIPETLPIWDVLFEPTKNYLLDRDQQRLNLFQKTKYLKNARPSMHCPSKFMELVNHVTGHDPQMRDDFLNWLAYIIQKRTKTQTAFIFHGRTGTGKGVLFTKVIRPILGFLHCPMIMMDDFDRSFNEWIETGLLVVVDEAQVNEDPRRAKKRINRIKNLITEAPTLLNKKNVQVTQIENHLNFIFYSNEHDSLWINAQDRRFKVCPRQETPLKYSEPDLEQLHQELQDIANYLIGYPINETAVRAIHHNQARENLINASQTTIDEFIDILKSGNLDDLTKYRDEFINSKNAIFHGRFEALLDQWEHSINLPSKVSASDLRVVYSYLFSTEIAPTKFGRILAAKNIKIQVGLINGKTTRYIEIIWKSAFYPHLGSTPCHAGATVN